VRSVPFSLALGVGLALAACTVATDKDTRGTGPDGLMAWPDLLERPRPQPSTTISYGPDPLQVVDVWLPAGDGPHPVALMVHGGCWQTEIADRTIMNWIADDLRRRGIAVWNIDYRGVDRGGGYPNTFLDVGAAADALRVHHGQFRLDLSNLVATGHSAGGHLALWLAARPKLPQSSPLRTNNPIAITKVVSLGGLPDLEEAARPPGSGCGTEVVAQISGGLFEETSVPRLGPLGVPQVLINGRQDRIIPTAYAEGYATPMRSAGDDVRVRMIDRTGHVELISPETAAWRAAAEEIEQGLRR
jgi:acetyl esterase/lipase